MKTAILYEKVKNLSFLTWIKLFNKKIAWELYEYEINN